MKTSFIEVNLRRKTIEQHYFKQQMNRLSALRSPGLFLSIFDSSIYSYCAIWLCFLIFFPIIAVGQEKSGQLSQPPKELSLFISQSDSVGKIEDLIENTLSEGKDTTLALAYCNIFLDRGRANDDYQIQYYSSYQIAYLEYSRSNYTNTVKNASISVKAAEKMQDTIKSISSNVLLGSTYYLVGAYDRALQSYLRAKELSKGIKNLSYEIICHTNIANLRMKLNRFKDALNSYNLILEILQKEANEIKIQFKEVYLSSLLGKGKCLAEINEFDQALETYDKGIKLSEKDNLQAYKSYFYINLGDIYYKTQDYGKALKFLNEGRSILKKNSGGQEANLHIANYYIARCYFAQKKYPEVISLLNENFALIGDNAEADKIDDMYRLAIEASGAVNDRDKQIFYYNKLESVIQSKSDKQLIAKDLLYEDDLKDYEIKNKKLVSEKAKNALSRKITLTVSILLVALLLVIFFMYYRRTRVNEKKFLTIIEDIQNDKSISKSDVNTRTSDIQGEKAKSILQKLQDLENTHFYISQDCNLYSTAKLLNTNTTYLSKALNETKKQSFNQYLNELRINYILMKLRENPILRSYTIRAIAMETGYRSATTFIKVFKSKTGLNPAYYIKKLELN